MRTLVATLAAGMIAGLALPAQAAIYSTNFSGTVIQQSGTTFRAGNAVAGSFTYSSDAGRFLTFAIDGFSASGAYSSSVSTTPGVNPYSALFQAQISATAQGGSVNRTFALDLEAANTFSASTALGILTTPTLGSQLDPSLTNFSYYSANSNGTGVVSLSATVNAISTPVPEPMSLALLATSVTGLAIRRRR